MKVVSVVGTRPNFNKEMLINKELRAVGAEEVLVHTGQHYDYTMSQVFFSECELPEPDYHLNVGSGLHGEQTARILQEMESVLLKERPDVTLVYGDVDSTVAAALASAKLRIPVAHIEAGPRCQLRFMPEEINRRVTDHISDILFAPTKEAYENLLREDIPTSNAFLTGDVVKDNLLYILRKTAITPDRGDYVLCTIHREENADSASRLTAIVNGLIASGRHIIIPLHPRTKKMLKRFNLMERLLASDVEILEPLGYIEFVRILAGADKVITDSGGVRREAYILGKPLITPMEEEGVWWPETVACGWNRVVGPDTAAISEALRTHEPAGPRPPIFGDGNAAGNIVRLLVERYDG